MEKNKAEIEEKLAIFGNALGDICKKAGVKNPSRIVGRKIIYMIGNKEGNHFAMVYDSIRRISIEVDELNPQVSGLFIKLNGETDLNGRRRSILSYSIEKNIWFWVVYDCRNNTVVEKHEVYITFPKKRLFDWL